MHEKRVRTVPYGGVRIEAECITEPCRSSGFSAFGAVGLIMGTLIDFPFTIAVDTLTLPYTIPKSLSEP